VKDLSTFITKMFLSVFMAGLFTQYLSTQSIEITRYCIETNDENKFIGYLETSDLFEFIISTSDYGLFFPIIEDLDIFLAIPWLGISVPFKSKNIC
jgi:hypothetical protein